jgi:arylsulfatase A-like enzyme
MKYRILFVLALALFLVGVNQARKPPNILLIIADDLSPSEFEKAPTPNLDRLAKNGIVFANVWANPLCSPTRANILTGRYSFRTGVGTTVNSGKTPGIRLDEFTIPKAFKANPELGYSSANIGKWHLSTDDNGGAKNPNLMGYDYYAGNLQGALKSFNNWSKTTNGSTKTVTNYATTENVNDALQWIEKEKDNPWFLWLAFNSPHAPFHLPPKDLHSFDNLSGSRQDVSSNPKVYYQAAIETMDTEIGRLLQDMPKGELKDTIVIFIGDNGSPRRVSDYPSHAKGTFYEGGIRVPMIISGNGIINPDRQEDDLVNVTDLFATILELAGVNVKTTIPSDRVIDSVNVIPYLKNTVKSPLREWIYSERFDFARNKVNATEENGIGRNLGSFGMVIRDREYKLIRFDDGREEFYNLKEDNLEKNNLLADRTLTSSEQNRYQWLSDRLKNLTDSEK